MGYNLIYGNNSQTGIGVEHNSDASIDFPIANGHVFVISDGHDGEQGHGALAAKMCVESIKKYFLNKSYKHMEKALTNAIVYANYTVFEQTQKDIKYNGMAAAVAVVIILKTKVYYAYAGDSRIYSCEEGSLKLLTKDHINPDNNKVYCLVGKQKDIKFGVCRTPINFNLKMSFLLCTDGVTDKLDQQDIKEVLEDVDMSPEHKALTIVDKAKEKKSSDSISAIVVERASEGNITAGEVPPEKKSSVITMFVVVLVALILGFGVFKGYQMLSGVDAKEDKEVVEVKKEEPKPVIAEPEEDVEEEEEIEEVEIEPEVEKVEPVSKVEEKKPEEKVNKPAVVNSGGSVMYKHKVLYGQNLYRLGLWYNVKQDRIVELNGDRAKKMIAGDILQIPVTAIYTVQQNDNLESISKTYSVSASKIKRANAKEKEWSLKTGEDIVIPLP